VLDFGISKLTDTQAPSALTGTGALLGTPHYMSPEQARGDQQIDTRSDQYSIGVILYQCVTGRRPLQGVPLYVLMQRTVHGDFPPPRQVHPALPSALEALILQAMARQPERRFPSTRALGQALAVFASDSVRSAYAAELGGAPAAVAATPLEGPVAELSTTLGESAHVRAVAVTKPSLPRRLGLASVLLLAAGFVAWRWAPRSTVDQTVAAALVPATQLAQPSAAVAPAPRPESPAAAPNAVAALQARAEHELAQGQLARAVDTFRKVYALGLDPLALSRAASAATELWRSTRRPLDCQQARELWLAHLAVVADADARAASKAARAELGACGELAEPARLARPTSRPASSTPAARLGADPASASETSPAAPRAPPLPSDDPGDGFLDVRAR